MEKKAAQCDNGIKLVSYKIKMFSPTEIGQSSGGQWVLWERITSMISGLHNIQSFK